MEILDILDILVISLIVTFIFRLIYKTEAFAVSLGLLVIFVIYFLASFIGLERTAFLFSQLFYVLSIGVFLIFHPEIRMGLKKLGRATHIHFPKKMAWAKAIEDAVYSLSERRVGALIILDPEEKLEQHTENMIKLDAEISKELLETIFHVNTALHDGAVIIQNNRIAYAGAKLPYSGKKREELENHGTRHAVALEMAESLDVVAIVVSEETGKISLVSAQSGLMKVNNRKVLAAYFKRFSKEETWQDQWKALLKKVKEKRASK